MTFDRLIIAALLCLLAADAVPMTKQEWRDRRHANERQFEACMGACQQSCRPRVRM